MISLTTHCQRISREWLRVCGAVALIAEVLTEAGHWWVGLDIRYVAAACDPGLRWPKWRVVVATARHAHVAANQQLRLRS